MFEIILIILGSLVAALILALAVLALYRRTKYYKKQVARALQMVPFLVTIPKNEDEEKLSGNRDQREIAREFIAVAENMYATFFGIYKGGIKNVFKNFIYRNRHIALEIVARKKEIFFYIVVPSELCALLEKAVTAHYPEAKIEEAEEYNIFSHEREMGGVYGGYVFGYKKHYYPIKTYQSIDSESMEAITNSLSMLDDNEGAAIQILIRPVNPKVMLAGKKFTQKIQKGPQKKTKVTEIVGEVVNPKSQKPDSPEPYRTTPIEEQVMKEIDRKCSKFGFETRIRVMVAAKTDEQAKLIFEQIKSAFAQFSDLAINGFKFRQDKNKNRLVTNFVFRFFNDSLFGFERFWPKERGYRLILSTEELASIYHFPNILVQTPGIKWAPAKTAAAPVNLPENGVVFAKTNYRGTEELVRITDEDRLRHMYVVGQTGVGKTNLLKTLIINDILAGNGVCYIDPHGDDAMDIINHIPKERAEDVIVFNPADTERPMGLNLFEADSVEEKDFVIQEAIQMLYRLYDPGHTGIMGPRFEHWFRNAALALMASPEGGTFIEVPRIFTDDNYLAEKLKHVTDPVVKNFWINEMGQTAEFHKSEVLGWFVGKFGAFMTNTTMRNILGQVHSSFNFSEIMDNKKILIVRLSKGVIGEMNMQLLGMIFISKLQMTAMKRASTPGANRTPFYMYIDEFQNFATDNIAQIFSEARKFKLSLIVANQYISQMREDIRDSVFGNVGTITSFRVSAEDGEYLQKQYEPEFDANDLINQENFNAVIKLIINGSPSRPFNIRGIYPLPGINSPEVGKAIIELSRLKHARPREVVDAEVVAKMNINVAAQQPGGFPREGGGG